MKGILFTVLAVSGGCAAGGCRHNLPRMRARQALKQETECNGGAGGYGCQADAWRSGGGSRSSR